MKATAKQISYLKKLTKSMYNDELIEKLTTKTASDLIQAWKIYTTGRPVIPQMYDWVQQAEKKASGVVIFLIQQQWKRILSITQTLGTQV